MNKFKENSCTKTFYIFCLFFYSIAYTQNIRVKNNTEHITIKKDSSFVKHISITLKKSDQAIVYPIFYDSELEKISDIEVYSKKGKRFKSIKKPTVLEDNIELDYIASKKVKSIVIPAGSESKISYKVECKELMYFSDLRFFSNNPTDTLSYRITVPKAFHFAHNTIYKDSLKHMTIDSISSDSITTWNIKVIPKVIEPDPLTLFGVYKNKYYPLMRTIVVPAIYKGNEVNYMNDWYLKEVKTKRGLNVEAINKIDELTKGISNPSKIIEVLYNYVRNNFKYVAIEVGMGAFIPTHTNEVFANKEGDCKDLSNFLSEALNYKGIQSNIALASTYDHITDCDFPSLSSANHVICLTYLENKPILLDPTDPIHLPKTPVQSIQNRSILIIKPDGGKWHKVKSFTPQQNLVNYRIKLKSNSDGAIMTGSFKVSYNGISGNFMKRELRDKNKDKVTVMGSSYYESMFGDQTISNFNVSNSSETIDTKGNLSVAGKIFNDTDNKILFIDFLPRLIENEIRGKLFEGTHLGSNFSKKVNLQIEMDKSFKAYKSIEYDFLKEGISFHLKITNPADSLIEISYEFICDYLTVDKKNHETINEVLKYFKKIINDPIILEKKD